MQSNEEKQQEVFNQLRQERLISAYMSQIMTQKAYERMTTVKFAKRELYMKVAGYLLQLKLQGKIRGYIDDKTLKELLLKFGGGPSGEITIKRK